jgi:hypothetical protein
MGTLADMIANTKSAMAARIGSVLMLRKHGEAETSNEVVTAVQGPNGGLTVEAATGASLVDVSTLATQTTAAAILAKIIAAPSTEAKQDTLNGYVVPGTWTPATGAAPADSAVISNAACKVRSVIASNRTSATVYMMLFDASAVPDDATAPRIPFVAIPGESTVQLALGGMACASGLCWSTTTTFGVKTIGATTPLVVSAELV